eukprot:SAG31_NODE_511_length_14722_cov_14.770499_2_plen_63_part_00
MPGHRSDEDTHPVFDITEEELSAVWDDLDKNEDGLLSRPKVSQLMTRLITMQKGKLKDIIAV